jgi:hypothetical protein
MIDMAKTIDESKFDRDIEIDNSSTWHFSECLKNHPRIEGEYQKILANAIKELDELTFKLEITTAEIAEEIFKKAEDSGNPIPASGKEAVFKGKVKLDQRYQLLRKRLMEAKYNVGVLKGYVKGMDSRGYRLAELFKLEERKLSNSLDEGQSKADKFRSVDEKIDRVGSLIDIGE